jgi:hypothetical protein
VRTSSGCAPSTGSPEATGRISRCTRCFDLAGRSPHFGVGLPRLGEHLSWVDGLEVVARARANRCRAAWFVSGCAARSGGPVREP